MFISVDPGLRVGVAAFHSDGRDHSKAVFTHDEFKLYLTSLYKLAKADPKIEVHFLYEDYKLRKDKALEQTGSDMPAPKSIGMLEQVAYMLGDQATIATCIPANLRTAFRWAGMPQLANKPKSWHPPDDLAAYAHGVMWLIQKDIRKHPIFGSD